MESGVGIASVAFRHKRRFVRRMLFGDSCDAKMRRWGEDCHAGVSGCACLDSGPTENNGKGGKGKKRYHVRDLEVNGSRPGLQPRLIHRLRGSPIVELRGKEKTRRSAILGIN